MVDRLGRTGSEILRNGKDLYLSIERSWQAFTYQQYLRKCDAAANLGAERAAEANRMGVWAVPGGLIHPWDWRHSRRGGSPFRSGANVPCSRGRPATHRRARWGPYRCKEIGSYARAQELLSQNHAYLDGGGDGAVCESLR